MSCFAFICPKTVNEGSHKKVSKEIPQGHYSSVASNKPTHGIELDSKKSIAGETKESNPSIIRQTNTGLKEVPEHAGEEEKQLTSSPSQDTTRSDDGISSPDLQTSSDTPAKIQNSEMKKSIANQPARRSIANRKSRSSIGSRSANSSFIEEPDEFMSMFKTEGEPLPMSPEAEKNIEYFDYIERIETDFGVWRQKTNKPFVRIFLRFGTDYNHELPSVMAFCNFELDASPEDFVHALYDVEARKKWDKPSVMEFFELSKPANDVTNYYMLNKAPWPFSDRYFIEERNMRYRSNGDIEVIYKDVQSDYVPKCAGKAEKARTIIGGQIVRRRIDPFTNQPTLLVTLINQTDMGGKIPPKVLSTTLPSSLIKWYRTVKKVIEKYKSTGQI